MGVAKITGADRKARRAELTQVLAAKAYRPPQEMLETTLAGMLEKDEALALWVKYGNVLDANAFDRYSNTTPLVMAARWNSVDMVRHLFWDGADPQKTPEAPSPLKEAAAHTNQDLTRLFLERAHWSGASLIDAVVAAAGSYCEQANPVILLLAEEMAHQVRQGLMTRREYQAGLRQALCSTTRTWERAKPLTSRPFRLSAHQTLMRILFLLALGAECRGLLDDEMLDTGDAHDEWTVSTFVRSLPPQEREVLEDALTREDSTIDRIRMAYAFLAAPGPARRPGAPMRTVDLDDLEAAVQRHIIQALGRSEETKTSNQPWKWLIIKSLFGDDPDRYEERRAHVLRRLVQISDLERVPLILGRLEAFCLESRERFPFLSADIAAVGWNDSGSLGRSGISSSDLFCLDPGPDAPAVKDGRLQQLRANYHAVRRESILATYGAEEIQDTIATMVLAAAAGLEAWAAGGDLHASYRGATSVSPD